MTDNEQVCRQTVCVIVNKPDQLNRFLKYYILFGCSNQLCRDPSVLFQHVDKVLFTCNCENPHEFCRTFVCDFREISQFRLKFINASLFSQFVWSLLSNFCTTLVDLMRLRIPSASHNLRVRSSNNDPSQSIVTIVRANALTTTVMTDDSPVTNIVSNVFPFYRLTVN